MKSVSQDVAGGVWPAGQEREAVLEVWYTGASQSLRRVSGGFGPDGMSRESVRFSHISLQGTPLCGNN